MRGGGTHDRVSGRLACSGRMTQEQRTICTLLKGERQRPLVRLLPHAGAEVAQPGSRFEASPQRRPHRALLAARPAALVVQTSAVGGWLCRPPPCTGVPLLLHLSRCCTNSI